MKKGTFLLLFSLGLFVGYSQASNKPISRTEYIDLYKDDAIYEMKRSGIPASITLAQGILESADGNSLLARKAKNHFGIKCHSDWTGKTFIKDDDKKDECFRKYESVLASFRDHSEFLKKKRYAFLFELEITDYKSWAKGLKKAGYATNPKYPQLLIGIIEKNELYQYDQMALNKVKKAKGQKSKPYAKKKKAKKDVKASNSAYVVKTHANNIKYIDVESSSSIEELADELNMGAWQFYKYNDLEKGSKSFEGGVLFLQPKKGRAREDFHTVEDGESMWEISQKYGIKLKKLYKRNALAPGEKVPAGQQLYLRTNKPR